jgi:hypothetical protein
MALTATKDDNGYVTMFFLLIPAFSALISLMLSPWIPGLRFAPHPMFFVGMGLVTIPLFLLSLTSRRARLARHSMFNKGVREAKVDAASSRATAAEPQTYLVGLTKRPVGVFAWGPEKRMAA